MEYVIAAVILIIAFFISPFLHFLGGWIAGWLIKVTIGGFIINGLAIVGLQIPIESLPLFFGTLAVVASFFKTYNANVSKS